jgi:hypothetical protein
MHTTKPAPSLHIIVSPSFFFQCLLPLPCGVLDLVAAPLFGKERAPSTPWYLQLFPFPFFHIQSKNRNESRSNRIGMHSGGHKNSFQEILFSDLSLGASWLAPARYLSHADTHARTIATTLGRGISGPLPSSLVCCFSQQYDSHANILTLRVDLLCRVLVSGTRSTYSTRESAHSF